MFGRRTRGFTLVELLVVIAIIGILIALLLPAVQAAREAARRTQCNNNLKQVSLAMHTYLDARKVLPRGVGNEGCCWGTWMVLVMPYMEQEQMSENWVNFGGNDVTNPENIGPFLRYSQGTNLNITRKRLPTMTCPTDQVNAPSGQITCHNYAVNYGNTSFFQSAIPIGSAKGVQFGGAPFNCYTGSTSLDATSACCPVGQGKPPSPPSKQMGVPVPIGEILDGTSNTMMVSEVKQGRGVDLRGFSWWGGASGFTAFIGPNSSEPDVVTGGACAIANKLNPPCVINSTAARPRMMGARSWHPGGLNASFCDGHVTFIKNTISINLWQAVSTSRGSETINAQP